MNTFIREQKLLRWNIFNQIQAYNVARNFRTESNRKE